jgi:hypothetical protein
MAYVTILKVVFFLCIGIVLLSVLVTLIRKLFRRSTQLGLALTSFVVGGVIVGAGYWLVSYEMAFRRTLVDPPTGRFVRLGDGPVWRSDMDKFGYRSLNTVDFALAFDTATGQICLTNADPELVGELPVMVVGPDGKPEPQIDPNTGKIAMRRLPHCSDLASH